MRKLKRLARTVAHRLGVKTSRRPRADSLLYPWIDRLQRDGPVECVFDVGANRAQTVTRLRSSFPDCTIFAFEPTEAAFKALVDTTKNDPAVKPYRLALGERDGTATLHENAVDATNSLLPNSSRLDEFAPAYMCAPVTSSTVPLVRLDTFCSREHVTRIDILKVDAQGYERRILEGAGALLTPAIIRGVFLEVLFVDLYQGQAWAGELFELLRSRGYRFFGFTEIAVDRVNGWKWADAMFLSDR